MSRWAPDLGAARVIGSGRTVAMLRRDATIDWWCPSTFDDPPLCWQLLDPHGGVATFQLAALLTSRDVSADRCGGGPQDEPAPGAGPPAAAPLVWSHAELARALYVLDAAPEPPLPGWMRIG